MNDITGYPLIPLEKNEQNLYPYPHIRYGILPYHVNDTGEIIWGCIKSNRVGPIVFEPAAGKQDIIALKDEQRIVLELGKPLPDISIDGFLQGPLFRGQVYQKTIEILITNGFNVYLESPLATAVHEAHEEHGIDLCKFNGRDQPLLKTSLDASLQFSTPGPISHSLLCVWLAELTHVDGVILRYTEKTDKKMLRNFGRQFYEQGCWVTIENVEAQLEQTKAVFPLPGEYTTTQRELITETLRAFELNLQLLKDISSLIITDSITSLAEAPQQKQEEQLSTNPYAFFNRTTTTTQHLLQTNVASFN